MFLLHYYLQKGIAPQDILALDIAERSFYAASMQYELEMLEKAQRG